jgi:hypothetical protein
VPSKWKKDMMAKQYKEHQDRIKNIKPVVDNKQPRILPYSGKKEIERKQYQTKVEFGNRLLLDRLGKAMETKNLDNENRNPKGVSLLATRKKLELQRISADNKRLLDRIQNTVPAYDHVQWERDAEHREQILKNMTEFPEYYVPRYVPSKKISRLKQMTETGGSTSPSKYDNILPPDDPPIQVRPFQSI